MFLLRRRVPSNHGGDRTLRSTRLCGSWPKREHGRRTVRRRRATARGRAGRRPTRERPRGFRLCTARPPERQVGRRRRPLLHRRRLRLLRRRPRRTALAAVVHRTRVRPRVVDRRPRRVPPHARPRYPALSTALTTGTTGPIALCSSSPLRVYDLSEPLCQFDRIASVVLDPKRLFTASSRRLRAANRAVSVSVENDERPGRCSVISYTFTGER